MTLAPPITAWRYWHIDNAGYDFIAHAWDWQLRGDIEVWENPLKEAKPHVARDNAAWLAAMGTYQVGDRAVDHDPPFAGCLCGVNAVKRLRSTDLEGRVGFSSFGSIFSRSPFDDPTFTVAFAQVELGGRVDEYEEGYRASQALIAGPIYVVNPPDGPGWQEALERRYGQPVITQELFEALDWIRKDEEANGHRQAHQVPRVGAAGGTGATITFAGEAITLGPGIYSVASGGGISLGAGGASITGTGAGAQRAREGRRARARLIFNSLAIGVNVASVVYQVGWGNYAWLAASNLLAAVFLAWIQWPIRIRIVRGRSGSITWGDLKPWLKAHGAKTVDATSIALDVDRNSKIVYVKTEGFEHDANGRPFAIGNDIAAWSATQPLRWLP